MTKVERIDDAALFDFEDLWGSDHVKVMTGDQFAAYMRLLSSQWREGDLPSNPRLLALRASHGERRVTAENLLGAVVSTGCSLADAHGGSIWHALAPCYVVDGDVVYNPRVRIERAAWLEKKKKWSKKSSDAGKASAAARRVRHKSTNGQPLVEPVVQPQVNSLSLSSSSSSEEPPLAPPGGNPPQSSSGPSKSSAKKTPGGRILPKVTIPQELLDIGLDMNAFAAAVDSRKSKRSEAWQTELDRLAPLVKECGRKAVRETWADAKGGGAQGCTPQWVRDTKRRLDAGEKKGAGGDSQQGAAGIYDGVNKMRANAARKREEDEKRATKTQRYLEAEKAKEKTRG